MDKNSWNNYTTSQVQKRLILHLLTVLKRYTRMRWKSWPNSKKNNQDDNRQNLKGYFQLEKQLIHMVHILSLKEESIRYFGNTSGKNNRYHI